MNFKIKKHQLTALINVLKRQEFKFGLNHGQLMKLGWLSNLLSKFNDKVDEYMEITLESEEIRQLYYLSLYNYESIDQFSYLAITKLINR